MPAMHPTHSTPTRRPPRPRVALMITLMLGLTVTLLTAARPAVADPQQLLASYRAGSGETNPSVLRGQAFFTGTQGRDWRCASCHGERPTQPGRHVVTGKPIAALAPAYNPERFSDAAKSEKWFRRNCKDVLGRECTPAEKADTLAWLLTLKP